MANVAAKMMTPTSGCKSGRRPRRQASAGFTLLELLLVLTIIGMASILVVPKVGNLDSRTFNVQLRQAHSLLNHARRDAVVRGQPSSIAFVPGDADPPCGESNSSNVIASWQSDDVTLRFEDSSNVESPVEDCLEITFYPEGGSSGGSLFLIQGEQVAQLDIDPFSGRIRQLDEAGQ